MKNSCGGRNILTENMITCDGVHLKHINTVFTYVSINKLKLRDIIPKGENEFKKSLYESIKRNSIKDPLLVWFLTGVAQGPKSGFMVRVGSSRLQICNEHPELGIENLPCFVLNYQGDYKSKLNLSGFYEPLVQGELMDSRFKVLKHCGNKHITLRFSEEGWLVFAFADNFLEHTKVYDE